MRPLSTTFTPPSFNLPRIWQALPPFFRAEEGRARGDPADANPALERRHEARILGAFDLDAHDLGTRFERRRTISTTSYVSCRYPSPHPAQS